MTLVNIHLLAILVRKGSASSVARNIANEEAYIYVSIYTKLMEAV